MWTQFDGEKHITDMRTNMYYRIILMIYRKIKSNDSNDFVLGHNINSLTIFIAAVAFAISVAIDAAASNPISLI